MPKPKHFLSIIIVVAISLLSASVTMAAFDNDEPLLTPAGFSTADTLKQQSWFLAPQGWLSYGFSDHLTLTWDWFVAFGGIPAGYLRYQWPLGNQKLAFEAYAADFLSSTTDKRIDEFRVEHRHNIEWARFNWTGVMPNNVRLHAYGGITYFDYLRYAPNNNKGSPFQEKIYNHDTQADYGVAIEWSVSSTAKIHFNYTSGNTFTLFDQIPHKSMAVAGLHLAPFEKTKSNFLSRFRIELNTIYIDIPNAHYKKLFPLFPVIYWQWTVQ